MKVAIIGCGPSGLCAIKNCISEKFEVVAFEQSSEIGGEWNLNSKIGPNVHSKIYEGLVTNLAKELMQFSDFFYDENVIESYLTPDKVQKYFLKYTEKFNLRKFIKFDHKVINVRPIDDQWEIIFKNLRNEKFNSIICDKVFICNGLSTPRIPKIQSQKEFQGKILHSRDYRTIEIFRNEKVLIIGSGASAFDMVIAIDKVANKLTWVHKIQQTNITPRSIKLSPTSTVKKYSIKKFTKTGAEFEDGSFEEFSIIVFATGYDFTFPFLSVDSGISVYDKCVQPLYKQCINANRPSLAIIGLPYFTLRIPLFEIQIKFCIEFWSGRRKFPNRNEMLKDIKKDFQNRNVDIEGNSHKVHYLGFQNHHLYYEDLARTAGIENVKPSHLKLSTHLVTHTSKNYHTFRDFKYKILNDFEFSCECFEKENN